MHLLLFLRVNSQQEDKTEAISDASLPSPDLMDLLLSEAKELLEPILSNTIKDGKFCITLFSDEAAVKAQIQRGV